MRWRKDLTCRPHWGSAARNIHPWDRSFSTCVTMLIAMIVHACVRSVVSEELDAPFDEVVPVRLRDMQQQRGENRCRRVLTRSPLRSATNQASTPTKHASSSRGSTSRPGKTHPGLLDPLGSAAPPRHRCPARSGGVDGQFGITQEISEPRDGTGSFAGQLRLHGTSPRMSLPPVRILTADCLGCGAEYARGMPCLSLLFASARHLVAVASR